MNILLQRHDMDTEGSISGNAIEARIIQSLFFSKISEIPLLKRYQQVIFAAEIFVSPLEASIGLMSSFVSFRVEFKRSSSSSRGVTLQKFGVCAQRNVPATCFKICYILCIRKPMQFFSFFISCNFIFLPYECPVLYRHRPGHS